jgi:hypothetical protein
MEVQNLEDFPLIIHTYIHINILDVKKPKIKSNNTFLNLQYLSTRMYMISQPVSMQPCQN